MPYTQAVYDTTMHEQQRNINSPEGWHPPGKVDTLAPPGAEKPPGITHSRLEALPALLTPLAKKLQENTTNFNTASEAKDHIVRQILTETLRDQPHRDHLLREIDERTYKESIAIKERGNIDTDIFIIGTGPHATAFANHLRYLASNVSLLFAEKNTTRGGQFREITESYGANSPNQKKQSYGGPYETDYPNDIGTHAAVQTRDLGNKSFPTNVEIGSVNAINNFDAAPAMVHTEVVKVEKNPLSQEKKYKITVKDLDTGRLVYIHANTVIAASGLGQSTTGINMQTPDAKTIFAQNPESVLTFPQFMEALSPNNLQSLKKLLAKNIAIVGAEDGGKIAIEKLIDMYRNGTMIGPIDLFGAHFTNAEKFQRQTIERYHHLTQYLPKTDEDRKHASFWQRPLVMPYKEKVTELRRSFTGKIKLDLENRITTQKTYGLVIFATGYKNMIAEIFKNISQQSGSPIPVYDGTTDNVLARKLPYEDIYMVGPSAQIPYGWNEAAKIPDHHQARYVNSLHRLIPRTEKLAEKIALSMLQKSE